MNWNSIIAICGVVLLALSGQRDTIEPAKSQLTLSFHGIENLHGELHVAVFDNETDWLTIPVLANVVAVNDNEAAWAIDSVDNGVYGVAVFHDLNGNGKNDTNFIGIPKEPWGVSNDERRRSGPPRWSRAKFEVRSDTLISIRIK